MHQLKCNKCGKSFFDVDKRAGRCGDCSQKKGGRVAVECQRCGLVFYALRSAIARGGGKYCSRDCYFASRVWPDSRVSIRCKWCGRELLVYSSQGVVHCSTECMAAAYSQDRRDENNFNWKGGSPKGTRQSLEYVTWRKAVYARDNWTCQDCGAMGKMNAHHLFGFTEFENIRFEVWNGVTLCSPCHWARHKNPKQKGKAAAMAAS